MKLEAREKLLTGRTAVVTGAGSGVGKAIANLFAKSGCAVGVVDVVPERVSQVVAEVRSTGAKVNGMVYDLANKEQVDKMVDESLGYLGRVDILCNNAGIMDGVAPVAETTDELWQRVMDVNLNAPFRASRKIIPYMLKEGGGVIINTASVAGVFGGVAGAAYTVSKHALIGLTKNIAAYYGSKGIRCNAMVLGGVNTNIGIGSRTPNALGMEHLNKVAGLIPRMGEPQEIAELALFLASNRSSYMNGSCVVIDGGWTIL
ncbi:MAG: SDR family oxidoreductase [Nitrososphaerales archaeon]|nr:SDR family oxidoreductase [Nitrososphaerales archaeon]